MALNKDKIDALWVEITPKLYGYLINTLKDRNLADDILQTTWLKAIEALPRFENRNNNSFSAWLFTIARNECKQHWRKPNREVPFDPIVHDREDTKPEQENKILVEQILAYLSESDRELIRLRYLADLPLNDIAKILNINPIAVRVRMHRAMASAKIILNNQNHEQ